MLLNWVLDAYFARTRPFLWASKNKFPSNEKASILNNFSISGTVPENIQNILYSTRRVKNLFLK